MKPKLKWADFKEFIENVYNRDLWPSSNGTIYKISEMSTDHLKNALAKTEREQWRELYQEKLILELRRRSSISYYIDKLIGMIPKNDTQVRITLSTLKQEMRPILLKYKQAEEEASRWLNIK